MNDNKIKKSSNKILLYTFLLIVSFITLFPFAWMLTGATNTTAQINSGSLLFGNNLKDNWNNLIEQVSLLRVFWNTLKISSITTVLSILICSMAGYGFEKFSSRFKNILYSMFLLSMMIPFAAKMIPLFKMMSNFGLMNTHASVILPFLSLPFLIFFFRQNFKAIPDDLIEAARIDGLGEFQIFFFIVLPTMKSTFAAGAIYAFMKQWNNFLWPLIILQTDNQRTFTLAISALSSAYYVDYGRVMLAIVMATIPMIIIFLSLQSQFVKGMVGSTK